MSEHLIVQTENLTYTITKTIKEHGSLAFATSKEASEGMIVQFELLQGSADISTVLQHVQQEHFFQRTTCYAGTLLLEEGNKCFELVESSGFVSGQIFVLQKDYTEVIMDQRQCHGAMTQEDPGKGNTNELLLMIEPVR